MIGRIDTGMFFRLGLIVEARGNTWTTWVIEDE